MSLPLRLRLRGKGPTLPTIYLGTNCDVVYWRATVDGRRRTQFKQFRLFADARRHADSTVRDLTKGPAAAASTAWQANDAWAAIERLRRFYVDTGVSVSLLEASSAYAGASTKPGGKLALSEAVDRYLGTVATVKRMDLSAAVEAFIAAE
jgi:hypothetical protein